MPDPCGALRLIGRVDDQDSTGPRFAWSGTTIQARFRASSVAVRLRGSSDYFAVTLDGAALPVLVASPCEELYPVAAGLAPGEHELVLCKRTEPLVSEAQLLGLELGRGGALLPAPPPSERRLEFIGDSITAGFGVLAPDASTPFSPATEDFTRSFAALTGQSLGAEVVALAWSGRGVCRNYADEPGDPMPLLYERTLPGRPESRWDFACWVPQAVVINLGTNDFSLDTSPPERTFIEAYCALLRRVRSVYPQAVIVCALGPMLSGSALVNARSYLAGVLEALAEEGERGISSLEFPPQSAGDGYGADGHPSAATHLRMARTLTKTLRRLLGW